VDELDELEVVRILRHEEVTSRLMHRDVVGLMERVARVRAEAVVDDSKTHRAEAQRPDAVVRRCCEVEKTVRDPRAF
jgi:hypothetical protein